LVAASVLGACNRSGWQIEAMRWFWIDRFTEFVSGSHAVSTKSVSLTEEQVDEYFPGYPVLSPSFVIEGFAQSGGLLIGQVNDFRERVVLAKVTKALIHEYARPGDTLTYRVMLRTMQSDGGLVEGTSHIGHRLQCEAEIAFAIVSRIAASRDFFKGDEFLRMLRIFRLFEVGVDGNGKPLKVPEHLRQAESEALRIQH
jgi:3-hydroxyacyl-[acyl-carrier-protein] dehydratase